MDRDYAVSSGMANGMWKRSAELTHAFAGWLDVMPALVRALACAFVLLLAGCNRAPAAAPGGTADDHGVRAGDGTVRFLGLLKAMFTRNGFNVYPREVERVIGALPGVTTVRAWAVPEPSRENDVAVEIAGAVTEAEVRRWCEARLSAYKQPSVITITR